MSQSVNPVEQLWVAINAQILPGGGYGGVESVLIGLVHALGQLKDGQEEYVIIGPWQNPEWLKSYTGPNQRIIQGVTPPPPPSRPNSGLLQSTTRKMRNLLVLLLRKVDLWPEVPNKKWPEVPISDGFFESLGCDVIHFPYQEFVVCALPSVYNPHDLQHLHYPQFFTPLDIAHRETIYPAGCHFAHTIAVASQWV